MSKVMNFLRRQDGTETVEWAIIIGIIAVGSIATIIIIGTWVKTKFDALCTAVQGQ